mgnify:CR=1 FL=1
MSADIWDADKAHLSALEGAVDVVLATWNGWDLRSGSRAHVAFADTLWRLAELRSSTVVGPIADQTTKAEYQELAKGNGPSCNPYEGATPEQIAAELPVAWRASTLRTIALHFRDQAVSQKNTPSHQTLVRWGQFLAEEADRIEEAE